MVWDAVSDPIFGWVGDWLGGKKTTVRLFFGLGIPIASLGFLAAFSLAPASLSTVYAVISLIFFYTGITLINVPHNALLPFLAKTPSERTVVASMRIFFSSSGRLFVGLIGISAFSGFESSTLAYAVQASAGAICLAAAAILTLSFWSVRNATPATYANAVPRGTSRANAVRTCLTYRPLTLVFLLTAINSIATPVFAMTFFFYGRYGLNSEVSGSIAATCLASTQTLSMLLWPRLTQSLGSKRAAASFGYVLLTIASAVGAFGPQSIVVLLVASALIGFALGGIYMLNWSILSDTADDVERNVAGGMTFRVFSYYSVTNKAFSAMCAAIVGFVLSAFGYSSTESFTNQSVLDALEVIWTLPVVGSLAALTLLAGFGRSNSNERHRSLSRLIGQKHQD